MNYSYMKVFYTVAKHQNISKASKELDVSQPAVSRIISNLEEEYHTRLFLRTKFGVTLTREGLNLYDTIKGPYAELEKLENSIEGVINLKEVVVHIGATATALYCFLFKFLEVLKREFPLVTFRLYTDSSSNLLEMVNKGIIDFAFVTTPFNVDDDIEIDNFFKLNTIVIAPSSYKDEINGKVSLKSLTKYPFVLLNKEMQFRQHVNDFLNKYNIRLKPTYEVDSSSTLLPMVENNYGLTFIPDVMAEPSIKEGRCFKVDTIEDIPIRYVSFAIRKDASYSSIIYDIKTVILNNAIKE